MWKIRFICIPVELVAYYGTEIGGNVPDDSLYRLVPQSVTPRNSNTFSRKITTGLSLCGRKNYKKHFFKTIIERMSLVTITSFAEYPLLYEIKK